MTDESKPVEALGLVQLLVKLGVHLGFEVATEVQASEAAWVDVVWFDRRIPFRDLGVTKPRIRYDPVLPAFGFEVELKTGLNAKHIKGSVSNLNTLCAQVGVIVIGSGNIALARSSTKKLALVGDAEIEAGLVKRAYGWIHAEAQPRGRVVLMTERQVLSWAQRTGCLPEAASTVSLTAAIRRDALS
jgi:hypothetical protein